MIWLSKNIRRPISAMIVMVFVVTSLASMAAGPHSVALGANPKPLDVFFLPGLNPELYAYWTFGPTCPEDLKNCFF